MRSFAMDSIEEATASTKAAKAVSKRELSGFVGEGYGIFSGATVRWAKLRFSAERARWVSRELWHPLQRTAQDEGGRLILEVPFTDMRELSMDILRHGRHVEVLDPAELRVVVQTELRQALKPYGNGD
jgi:predicted DNA-binding transcriptional regulator YafY